VRTIWQALAAPKPREQAAVNALMDNARLRDPLGHQIQTVLAIIYLITLPLATAASGIAFALLLANTLLRLPHTARVMDVALDVRSLWWFTAFIIWCAISLTWSPDPGHGFDEIAASRVLLTPLMLWPILDRLPWLIAAALVGVFAQNAAQLLHALDWVNLRPDEGAGRHGGLIHPIHSGAWCVAAMCWHLFASWRGRGWIRWISIVGLLIAAAGLVATGSRGPWISALISIPLMAVVTLIRRPPLRKPIIVLGAIMLVASVAAWPKARVIIADRVLASVGEWQRATDNGVYWTSVGARVGMNRWAWAIFRAHPLCGIGAGGYPSAQAQDADFQAAMKRLPHRRFHDLMVHDHPHSSTLYLLSTTGIIGSLLFGAGVFTALRRAWRDPPNNLYADAAFFIMIGWIVGAQFDTYNLNGHLWGMFALLIALTMPKRPPLRLRLSAKDDATAAASPMASSRTGDFLP
jgi:O-antigen ligase